MKILMSLVSFFAINAAYASANPMCDKLAPDEVTRITGIATDFFHKSIGANMDVVPNSFKGATYSDCYDNNTEFDRMVFELSWKAVVKDEGSETTLLCYQKISVNRFDQVAIEQATDCQTL